MSGAPAQVPDQVLRWLYNSLAGNYRELDRAYADVAQALSSYPTVSPRTEIYTYENGASQLMLLLQGTVPVPFRGNTYRYPIAIWLPHAYPREPPMAFVKPTADMAVRPGQHVSVEGRIYHPYLANWADHWTRSSVKDLIGVMRDVFAKEPPVVARQQGQTQAPRPPPPQTSSPAPPAVPPKPGDSTAGPSTPGTRLQSGQAQALPPLPPKPGQSPQMQSSPPTSAPARDPRLGPPAPLLPWQQQQQQQQQQQASPGFAAARPSPALQPVQSPFSSSPAPHSSHQQQYQPPLQDLHGYAQRPSQYAPPVGGPAYGPPTANFNPHLNKPATKQPVEDLMNSPLDVTLPSQSGPSAAIPAPPIPRNPEKDALVQAAASTLRAQITQIIAQNAAAVPALEAQHVALQQALHRMQAELYQLEELDKTLASNEKTLHESMREADRVVDSVSRREVPSVDEVLVAPTVVGEQLYNLVAEERSIADAMFLLARALDQGRISGEVFVKQTRSLAREQYVKKALIRKIAQGMGLSMPRPD